MIGVFMTMITELDHPPAHPPILRDRGARRFHHVLDLQPGHSAPGQARPPVQAIGYLSFTAVGAMVAVLAGMLGMRRLAIAFSWER